MFGTPTHANARPAPRRVLLVEDNPAEARLIQAAIEDQHLTVTLEHAPDGETALRMLDDGPSPDLVLLDLNLPGLDGREVLRRIKRDARLSQVPVVVLTTSNAPADVAYSYTHHASSYVRKPLGFDDLGRMLRRIATFYFDTAVLPAPAT